ncbi:MAG TPA: hypothetical protein DCX54_00195 [Flavobacteriales bacterium]|nr:hypothetical protein [Flavobacteriales bacterium]
MKISPVERITTNASDDSCGSSWGGHQGRIVRTSNNVYAAYTVPGKTPYKKQWQLKHRIAADRWEVIYKAATGREPVHLLTGQDGCLHVVGWSKGLASIWTGKPSSEIFQVKKRPIPGMVKICNKESVPYSAAGITPDGDLFVLSTEGEAPSKLLWALLPSNSKKWITGKIHLDLRFCYAYVFPRRNRSAYLIASRDVKWHQISFQQPIGALNYTFNAIGAWFSDNVETKPFKSIFFMEEKPTIEHPNVLLNAQTDVYIDDNDRTFILYRRQGVSTQGALEKRMLCLSSKGETLYDVELPENTGDFSRLIQIPSGSFYLLGSSGFIFPAGKDGKTFGQPYKIDLDGCLVEYSGYSISSPRTGTSRTNIVDVMFPTEGGKIWRYFNIEF